jgi:hypothetical protein
LNWASVRRNEVGCDVLQLAELDIQLYPKVVHIWTAKPTTPPLKLLTQDARE